MAPITPLLNFLEGRGVELSGAVAPIWGDKMKFSSVIATVAALGPCAAWADVSISGFGRFGLTYSEAKDKLDGENSTFIQSRLRLEFDASVDTDVGVKFGAKTWVQGDHNSPSWGFSPANFYAEYENWTLEVGNVLPAFDGAFLLKQTRLGAHAVSVGGDPLGDFFLLAYRGYGRISDRTGITLNYGTRNFDVKLSVVDPDQIGAGTAEGLTKEVAASIFYRMDDWEFSMATAQNGAGIRNNDLYFFGTRYKINDEMRLGLNVNDNGLAELGTSYAVYGDYKFRDFTFGYYIGYNDGSWSGKTTDGSYGVALRYDLGPGVFLATSVQRDYESMTLADIGVRFDF